MADWVCAGPAGAVEEGGAGVRFELTVPGFNKPQPGFVVRFDGQLYSYLNRCGHVPVELDWPEGQFFDDRSLLLVCATHGASYHPSTGRCAGGPCAGRGLVPLQLRITDDKIWVRWPET